MADLDFKDFSAPEKKEERPPRLQPKFAVFVPEWKTAAFFFSEDAIDTFMRKKGMK